MIFPLSADQKIFFSVYKVSAVIFSHFKIRGKLNGIGRTCLFTETAEMHREKLMRKNSGYLLPCSSSAD